MRDLPTLSDIAKGVVLFGCMAPLVACEPPGTPDVRPHTARDIRVWSDPQTGCEYVIVDRPTRGGMTARLNSDGTPMCPNHTGGEDA